MTRLLQLVMGVAIAANAQAVGADDETPLYQMEETVITGSKVPQTAGNVTQKIDIISAAELDGLVAGNGNLAELLSFGPGNFANVLSRNDANWGSSSGLAHTYKGYMLDGLPVDAFIDLQSLDPWAFARIEDQRGSASVLYPTYLSMDFGGNQSPLAGTANFILRERVGEARTRVSTYYGSFNTVGTRVYHQQAAGNLHWFVGAHYEDSDYTDYGTPDSWLNMIDDPAYEKLKAYVRGTYFIDGDPVHRVSVYAHRTWHSGDAGRPNRGFSHVYTTINAHYFRPLDSHLSAQLRLGYRDYVRTWEDDAYPASIALTADNGMLQTVLPLDASLSWAHREGGLLTLGTDYQVAWYETYAQTDQLLRGNDARALHLGLYAQEEQSWNHFVFRVGARLNRIQHDIDLLQGAAPGDDSESWTRLLWSVGSRYSPGRTVSVYANLGTSFRAPSLKSVGGTIPLSEYGREDVSGHLPNPQLDPESGLSLDLGADYRGVENLVLGARGFLIRLTDQIVPTVVTANGSQSQDINAGKARTAGLELELRHSPLGWLQWSANYTFTDTEIDNPRDPDKDGAEINFVPRHVINLGGRLALPGGLSTSLSVQRFSSINESVSKSEPRELRGYALLTARIEKQFADRDGRELRLFLEPYNLSDERFEMPWGFRDPGFSATGGITASF